MDFTALEHIENLNRLHIDSYFDLIGTEVYYVKPVYGKHKIISYDETKEEYLLDLEGQRFKSNPFRIILIK